MRVAAQHPPQIRLSKRSKREGKGCDVEVDSELMGKQAGSRQGDGGEKMRDSGRRRLKMKETSGG
jgi:hypothetical protein